MRPIDKSILVFSTIYLLVNIVLIVLGERRPDTYASVSILLYYVYISLDDRLRHSTNLKLLNIILFIVFISIVGYRIYEILSEL